MMTGLSFMSALVTLTAQNQPSKNYTRILRGMACAIVISVSVSGLFCLLCQVAPAGMYALFTSDPNVALAGADYLRLYSISFVDEVFMFCMFGVLTGAGYTTVTMISSITMAVGVRYFAAMLLSRYTVLGFNGIALAYSLAPILGIAIAVYFLISGKWKTPRIATR